MKVDGYDLGGSPAPDICQHIKNVCNQLLVNGCIISAAGKPFEIICDKCRKVLESKHILP